MNEKISLQDLVELLNTKHGMPKKNADALTNDKYVKIKGLGTFKLTEVDSRESMNVNTGERIEIQGHTKISFTPDTTMKELINKPFSHFETVMLNEGVLLEDTPVVDEEVKSEDVADEMAENVVDQPIAFAEDPVEVEQDKKVEEDLPAKEELVETSVLQEPILEEQMTTEAKEEAPAPVIEAAFEDTVSHEVAEEETPVEEKEIVLPVQKQVVEEKKVIEEPIEKEQEVEVPVAVPQQNKSTYKVLIGIIIVLLLVILFGFYWMFFRTGSTSGTQVPQKPLQEETIVNQVNEQPVVKEDTLQTVKDTVVVQPEVPVQTTVLQVQLLH